MRLFTCLFVEVMGPVYAVTVVEALLLDALSLGFALGTTFY